MKTNGYLRVSLLIFSVCFGLSCSYSLYAQPVNDQLYIQGSDSKLYLEVAGDDANKPLVLFLHGGPGNVVLGLLPFQSTVGSLLEEEFLVAYLHQRGAGKSPAVPLSSQTLDKHLADVAAIVGYLKRHYAKEKVHLVGHSWGGMLAAQYAVKDQASIDKLIFITCGLNSKRTLRESYHSSYAWAEQVNNTKALETLDRIQHALFDSGNRRLLSGVANQAHGGIATTFDFTEFFADHKIPQHYPNWSESNAAIPRAMYQTMLSMDMDQVLGGMTVPALFIAGRRDAITPVGAMQKDFAHYGGTKSLVVLERSHHLPFIDEPESMARAMSVFLDSADNK